MLCFRAVMLKGCARAWCTEEEFEKKRHSGAEEIKLELRLQRQQEQAHDKPQPARVVP